jgi:hypothetical protein
MVRSRGNSLIELAVVFIGIAIVGVVLAVTTTDAISDSEVKRADQNADRVVVLQQRFAQQHGSYSGYPQDLGRVEGFNLTTEASSGPDVVSIALGEQGTLGVAARRDDRNCVVWRVYDLSSGGGAERIEADGSSCDGTEALGDEPEMADGATASRATG